MIKLIGTKLKHGKDLDFIWFYLRYFISWYSKLIVWVMEGRTYTAVGDDQCLLMVIPW